MHNRIVHNVLICLMIAVLMVLGACKPASEASKPEITTTVTTTEIIASPTSIPTTAAPYPISTSSGIIEITSQPYPQPTSLSTDITPNPTLSPIPTNTITQPATQVIQASPTKFTETPIVNSTSSSTPPSPSPSPSPTVSDATQAYPGPQNTPTSPAYPGPIDTATPPVYPGPITQSPFPTSTLPTPGTTVVLTPSPTIIGIITPTPINTPIGGTPRATPTELPPQPPISPPPAGSSVTIWHSWSVIEVEALQSIIDGFKRYFPDVTFSLLYVPIDELYDRYYEASYFGRGPELLLGPSNWGPEFFKQALIHDLTSYVDSDTLADINPVAISSGKYKNSLISLPLSVSGQLLFRNTSIIAQESSSLDELIKMSQDATYGGTVGSYLERGSYFSSADIVGLGGNLMTEDGAPAFNSSYGLEWVELLNAYDEAGAVTFNTNRDLDMFKKGRVGIIIDGSWNIANLSQAIGADNLSIDAWPSYGTGHLAGWVQADSAYVNSSIEEKNLFATLSFIGYLLDPNVQMRLAEVGHIPSVMTTQPRDPLIDQAMIAFKNGAPYPNLFDNSVLDLYWEELDRAILNIFQYGSDPAKALREATNNIAIRLREAQP